MKIAIQGEAGSFHAEAVAKWRSDQDYQLVYCVNFANVFDKLNSGQVDLAMVAVENNIYGPIDEVQQLIRQHRLSVVTDIKLPIAQQLIGLPGTNLLDIKTIYSHPVALAQCRHTLSKLLPLAGLVEYYDTAAAIELVKDRSDPRLAAIASRQAAELHELPIIYNDVHDEPDNTTHFVGLSR